MVKIASYKELQVWQESMNLVELVYKEVNHFPSNESYGLTSQIRRAVVSIPSNIAEGFMRKNTKEFIQFLHVSLGSLGELDTQMEIALRVGYLSKITEINSLIETVRKLLYGLIKSLKKRL
ncbi:four helix bundle protein [Sunxiuqinia rutila]|uniref:four helix bundle protein n=1 Tax=Sunxiuqinia rutila TaxID=1397841 RepID=UPI003D364F09